MKIISYNEANNMYIDEFWKGRNKGIIIEKGFSIFPYNILYNNESFVEISVNISDIVISQLIKTKIVNKYIDIIKKNGSMKGVWLTFGKKMKNGNIIHHYHKKIEASDGNHRIKAYKLLGYDKVKGYIPITHYNFYIKERTWQIG